jgi:LytS/YehU family sensor histidine kinase
MQEQPTWRIWIVLLIAIVLQTTLLARLTPLGTHIDLLLLTIVSIALLIGPYWGSAYGLAAGILLGFYAGVNPGAFALSRMAAGGVFGLFDKGFSGDNPLAPPLCAAGATLMTSAIFLLMSPTDFTFTSWLQKTLAAIIVHAILIWPVHACIAKWALPPRRSMYV